MQPSASNRHLLSRQPHRRSHHHRQAQDFSDRVANPRNNPPTPRNSSREGGGGKERKKKKALIRLRLVATFFFPLFVFPSSLGEWSNFWISRCTSLCKFSLFTIKFANGGKVSIKFFVELSLTFLRVLVSFWRKNGYEELLRIWKLFYQLQEITQKLYKSENFLNPEKL